MDEPRARSASRLADLPAGVELGEYYSRQVEARPFILHPGSRWLAAWSLLRGAAAPARDSILNTGITRRYS